MSGLPLSATGKTAPQVARECAGAASRIMLEAFGSGAGRSAKGRRNFVTDTDLACEHAVLDILRREYPEHAVLSEETASAHPEPVEGRWDQGWLWIVDPLDGTHNFSQGIPHFAFNIALCLDGVPVLGLTHAPAVGEEFFAERGRGLMVNGRPAHASAAASVAESVLGLDLGYDDARAARLLSVVGRIWPGAQAVRLMGSAALGLAYAACGRYGIFVHHYLFPWDLAAGIILVREGGGEIVSRDGGPATPYTEGVVSGAPAAVRDFLRLAGDEAWR